jgi:hypothetical protein
MLFQNIEKGKKSFGGHCMGGAGMGTASPIEDALPASPYTAVLTTIWGRRWRCSLTVHR